MAELAHSYRWVDRAKVNKLDEHLRGRTEKYFQQHGQMWWRTQSSLWFIIEQMNAAFHGNISYQQTVKLLSSKKESTRTWNDHFIFLNAVTSASGASPTLVLENIVTFADPELMIAMMASEERANDPEVGLCEEEQALVENVFSAADPMVASVDQIEGAVTANHAGLVVDLVSLSIGSLSVESPRADSESESSAGFEMVDAGGLS
ncbi:hypothetical protein PF001_g12317 [Phytophthora fragariae]|uniref:Uncharacterized protein n=1 Tax=Phytophthora fragariae TaxID=53985 RepID=A0A6A3EQZ4_9STRA|nr:hypothetical protein PF009_g14138 [Phytophthora fragariae]KAE9306042.1 hypothetical protein PF001_g12317 [Phytophthora fragariae]